MENLARSLLEKLLKDAEKADVGRRKNLPVLTKSNMTEYQEKCTSLQAKETFETYMCSARAEGSIIFTYGTRGAEEGFINRVELVNKQALAKFLGKELEEDKLSKAISLLSPFEARFPVITDVLNRWKQLRPVRTFLVTDAQDWVDAVRVIDFARDNIASGVVSLPINEASGKLFKDTKRIKKLAAPLDVLLSGSIDTENRPPSEVWEEIGLFREEHPVRMAGKVIIERERTTGLLDTPYTGFPASTVIRLSSNPTMVITIENQTTFHSEAHRLCNENVLLIYTAGMPNPPWKDMYARILKNLPTDIPVYHWGDIDEGGFRIASVLATIAKNAGHIIKPWQMHPENVPLEHRRPASITTVNKMVYFAKAAGWTSIADSIENTKFTVEQESLA